MPKKPVRRRGHLDKNGIRRTGSKEEGFEYVFADGSQVSDEAVLSRILALRIPPAWCDVRIARSEAAPLQAVGVDKKGRTQYLYGSKFRQKQDYEKFQRLVLFAESLPRLRRRVDAALKTKDLDRPRVVAAMVRLIDQGFFRVGNDKSARSEETYGLTTVRSDHVKVRGSEVAFDYIGKWRKAQQRTIHDVAVAATIRRLRRLEGDELFKFVHRGRVQDVKDRHVNEFIQSIIGENFTAKDFRTWAGTLLCSIALAGVGPAPTKRESKRRVTRAIAATAGLLGNTPAVCRSSYICPELIEEYVEKGRTVDVSPSRRTGRPVGRIRHSREEIALLKFLRETIADRRIQPRKERRRNVRSQG